MQVRFVARAIGFTVAGLLIGLIVKTVLGQYGFFVSTGVLIAVIAALVESERNPRVGPGAQLTVYIVVAGILVSDPILWILHASEVSVFDIDGAATDAVTFLAGLATLVYSWKFRRKKPTNSA